MDVSKKNGRYVIELSESEARVVSDALYSERRIDLEDAQEEYTDLEDKIALAARAELLERMNRALIDVMGSDR